MKTALLFAGQGAQELGMGGDFRETSPTARRLFDSANELLEFDLASVCANGPEETLTETGNAQPAIYLVSWIALALLRERLPGFTFQATAGLSLGEITALAAAGAFSFEDGLRLVRQRGRFMQEACQATRGGMAAIIGLDETAIRLVCDATGVTLANLNCPGQVVISGAIDKIPAAVALAKLQGAKKAISLSVAGAYHSPLMADAQPKLARELAEIEFKTTRASVISNVTAQSHGDASQIRELLVAQLTSSVRWEDSIRHLLSTGFTRFIELGPGTALSGFMRRIDKTVPILNVNNRQSLEATVAALAEGS